MSTVKLIEIGIIIISTSSIMTNVYYNTYAYNSTVDYYQHTNSREIPQPIHTYNSREIPQPIHTYNRQIQRHKCRVQRHRFGIGISTQTIPIVIEENIKPKIPEKIK